MSSTSIDFPMLAEKCRKTMVVLTENNERVGNLFLSDKGSYLLQKAMEKVADLASKRVKNVQKAQEFAIWFGNEYEDKTGDKAPDKVVNLTREVCVNLLTPYKRLFFT